VLGLLAAAIITALVLAWRPEPVAVDLGTAKRGPMVVTVDEDGRTRVKDRYTVSAPLAGTLVRIALHAGDSVRRGQVVAQVVPLATPLLDLRSREESAARVAAAEAARRQAVAAVEQARAAHEFARREAERQRTLLAAGATAAQQAEQAETTERMRAEELTSAEFGLRVADSELRLARAALLRVETPRLGTPDRFDVRAPVDGEVLRVIQESEGVVLPGAALLEIGDSRALEIVVDVLTSDAVDILPGAPARITRWGGDSALRAQVNRVEPSAFTRISALGVEEQRVNVLIGLDEPRERWASLGDGFRVEASIEVWRAADALQVPAGAVFRHDSGWAVFRVRDGRAALIPVGIGRRSGTAAQVLEGLETNDSVVVYPGDNVVDGVRVEGR
jgi:HlyD family secretion protein